MYLSLRQKFHKLPKILVNGFLLSMLGVISSVNPVTAQNSKKSTPVCQAPTPGEYLLLVISPSKNNQEQLRRVLPAKTQSVVCTYLKDTVTRIGGFRKIEDANRWAKYVKDSAGLSAIITTRPNDGSKPQLENAMYKPRQLGSGYAVLVDYLKRPEMVKQVQEVVGGDVGFASYGQRPYLLAIYTNNQKNAYQTLQKLSDRGFFALIVDSRKVILLRSIVSL
ncbi:MAG: hypothetical protein QNJ63_20760 [Calothrix sp. MO_192.B10]|nr:hypothetical protein [Calothrix sp. MO_192.B10]